MKPLAYFAAGILIVFGVFAVVLNVARSTERIFVVVDSSFPMAAVWNQVPGALADVDSASYSEYALATEKALVHSWQDHLNLGATTPFAPCSFEGIEDHTEVGQASELILVTTTTSCPTDHLLEWRVIFLDP